MTRRELLQSALEATNARGDTYGKPEDNFATVASVWSAYLKHELTAMDVAMLMVLFKVVRHKTSAAHMDNLVDIAGYAACAAELGTEQEERNDQR